MKILDSRFRRNDDLEAGMAFSKGLKMPLGGAVLVKAKLTDAILTDAALYDADLTAADLTRAVISHANFNFSPFFSRICRLRNCLT
jgi:uncharacterized protein YjbI with pentapeptide repeats